MINQDLQNGFWEKGVTITEFIKIIEKLPQEIKDKYRIAVSEDYYGTSFSQGYDLDKESEYLIIEAHN